MKLKNMEIDNDYDSALNADLYVIVQKVCELLPRCFDYNEIHYQKVLARELSKDMRFGSFQISTEVNIPYCLDDGFTFGFGRADIVLENFDKRECIIIELKASVSGKFPSLNKYKAQVNKYVHHYKTNSKKKGVVIVFSPSYQKINARIMIH